MPKTWVQSLGGEDHLRRKWQPTPVFLPGESYGRRRLVGYSPWGHIESDVTEHACISCYILVCVCMLSRVWLFATPWTIVYQAPLSMGILLARILNCHALLQADLPNPGIEPRSPALQEDSLSSEPSGKPIVEKEIKHTFWDCSFYIPYVVILERSVELYCLDSILTSSHYLNPQKRIQINEINFPLKISGNRWVENELFRTTLLVKEYNLITSVQFFDLLL